MVTTHPYKRLIIKSILLKKILKRVSREIMGSVLTQYFKILITTVPFLGPGRDGLPECVQKYNRAVNNNIQNQ